MLKLVWHLKLMEEVDWEWKDLWWAVWSSRTQAMDVIEHTDNELLEAYKVIMDKSILKLSIDERLWIVAKLIWDISFIRQYQSADLQRVNQKNQDSILIAHWKRLARLQTIVKSNWYDISPLDLGEFLKNLMNAVDFYHHMNSSIANSSIGAYEKARNDYSEQNCRLIFTDEEIETLFNRAFEKVKENIDWKVDALNSNRWDSVVVAELLDSAYNNKEIREYLKCKWVTIDSLNGLRETLWLRSWIDRFCLLLVSENVDEAWLAVLTGREVFAYLSKNIWITNEIFSKHWLQYTDELVRQKISEKVKKVFKDNFHLIWLSKEEWFDRFILESTGLGKWNSDHGVIPANLVWLIKALYFPSRRPKLKLADCESDYFP